MAEVDPAYWGARTAQDESVSKTPSGKLKVIGFLDAEVLYWQRIAQLTMTKGRAAVHIEGHIPGAIAVLKERSKKKQPTERGT